MSDRSERHESEEARPLTGLRFTRNLDWNLLKTFHEIVEAGGLSNAAQRIGRKQPALSMALRRLEAHVGVSLCRRGPGGFVLSHAGEQVAEVCAEMFGKVSNVPRRVADMAEEVRGRVRMQLISNLVDRRIDDAIDRFHRAHPLVEIYVSVATWDVVSRAVLRAEAEIGIAPVHHRDPALTYESLFREVHRPYCGRAHPLFGRTVANPRDLGAEMFILTGADEPEQLTKYRRRHGLGHRVAGLSEHLEEARRLAVLGVGICFLPDAFVAREVADGLLHPLLPDADEPAMDILIITNPGAPTHAARDRLLDEFRHRSTG
ncbi:MAG: LysR family transcriptional regulator [Alphaproteobacteria bacterium]|nr:LysR family transcriptional regulator [Alphaproteobacteria bacterium]